jgi:hypothetical protein
MAEEIKQEGNDFLEGLIDLKRSCTIKFRSVEGGVSEIKARIIGLEEVSGREMIETDAGFSIGVDQLIEVNGRSFENYC